MGRPSGGRLIDQFPSIIGGVFLAHGRVSGQGSLDTTPWFSAERVKLFISATRAKIKSTRRFGIVHQRDNRLFDLPSFITYFRPSRVPPMSSTSTNHTGKHS